MNNTAENNRLMAEFMGLETGKQLGYDRWVNDWFDNRGVLKNLRNEKLLFDSDWNWLMEVVGEIENYNEYTSVLFFPQGCEIGCYIDNGFSFSNDCNTKIEAVYNACVEFIKWCNKQK